MIEVFRTNVNIREHAAQLLVEIVNAFTGYRANFDLEDCDRILRIQAEGPVDSPALIRHLATFGYDAEVLPDTVCDRRLIVNEIDQEQ